MLVERWTSLTLEHHDCLSDSMKIQLRGNVLDLTLVNTTGQGSSKDVEEGMDP